MTAYEPEQNNPYQLDAAIHRLNNLVMSLASRVLDMEQTVNRLDTDLKCLSAAIGDDIRDNPLAEDAPYVPVGTRLSDLITRHGLKTHMHETYAVGSDVEINVTDGMTITDVETMLHEHMSAAAVDLGTDHAADEAVRETVSAEQLPFDGTPEPGSDQDVTQWFCTLDELFDRIEGMPPIEVKLYPADTFRELTHIRRPIDDPGRIHIQLAGDQDMKSYLKEKICWYCIKPLDNPAPEPTI